MYLTLATVHFPLRGACLVSLFLMQSLYTGIPTIEYCVLIVRDTQRVLVTTTLHTYIYLKIYIRRAELPQ